MRKRGRAHAFDGVIYRQVGGAVIQRAVSGFAERKSDHWIRLLVGGRCIDNADGNLNCPQRISVASCLELPVCVSD